MIWIFSSTKNRNKIEQDTLMTLSHMRRSLGVSLLTQNHLEIKQMMIGYKAKYEGWGLMFLIIALGYY